MERPKILITAVLALLTSFSCSTEKETPIMPGPPVNGIVTDTEGNPLEYIQVTMEWKAAGKTESLYTSSKGTFFCEAFLAEEGDTELVVTLKDIDGEENGGLFEESVKIITLMEEELALMEDRIKIELAFHLNHATP